MTRSATQLLQLKISNLNREANKLYSDLNRDPSRIERLVNNPIPILKEYFPSIELSFSSENKANGLLLIMLKDERLSSRLAYYGQLLKVAYITLQNTNMYSPNAALDLAVKSVEQIYPVSNLDDVLANAIGVSRLTKAFSSDVVTTTTVAAYDYWVAVRAAAAVVAVVVTVIDFTPMLPDNRFSRTDFAKLSSSINESFNRKYAR